MTEERITIMVSNHNLEDWHLHADKFSFYGDTEALRLLPADVSNEEVQRYLYTFHNDLISTEEIRKLRFVQNPIEQE